MIEDSNKTFWRKDVAVAISIILLIFFIIVVGSFLSGCKVVRAIKKTDKDSTSVSKTNEGSSKIDSSGSKSDKTNTKETVYYPQPIYIQGKDGETKTVFVPQYIKETGSEKKEDFNLSKEDIWKQKYDSLMVALLINNKDSKTSVLNIWQILAIAAIVILVIKLFIKK